MSDTDSDYDEALEASGSEDEEDVGDDMDIDSSSSEEGEDFEAEAGSKKKPQGRGGGGGGAVGTFNLTFAEEQAIHVTRPVKKKAKDRLDLEGERVLFFTKDDGDRDKGYAEERYGMYQHCLRRARGIVEKFDSRWNQDVVNEVITFFSKIKVNEGDVVPVAFIPSNFSSDESGNVFENIRNYILHNSAKHLVRLTPVQCANVKSAFQSVATQLGFPKTITPSSMSLSVDPEEDSDIMESSDRSKNMELVKPLVVIMIEDADHLAPTIIQKLIELLCSSDLYVVYIFGVSYCVSSYERFIPFSTSKTFKYSVLQSMSGYDRFNQLFGQILQVDKVPFMLGGKVVEYLSEHFKGYDGSVQRLLQAYRICLIEHFRRKESYFCKNVNELTPSSDFIASVPSLQSFTKFTKASVIDRIEEGQRRMVNWNCALNVITRIQSHFNDIVWFRQLQEFYITFAKGTFLRSEENGELRSSYQKLHQSISNLSKVNLTDLISKIVRELKGDMNEESKKRRKSRTIFHHKSKFYSELLDRSIVEKLENLEEKLVKLDQNHKENQSPQPQELDRLSVSKLKKVMTREELRSHLQDSIKLKKKSNPFHEVRQEFLDYIDDLVYNHLKHFDALTSLHTMFVFDDVEVLKGLFAPGLRSDIAYSLCLPRKCLDCTCCKGNTDSLSPSLPDTSILFKLVREQTHKKINLNILYQSFSSIVENGHEKKRSRASKIKKTETDLNAIILRFRQAVGELQFIGVFKRSKRKPDEVTKLYWG